MVRESGLLVETLERVRLGLPFALRALDVDNGSEFVNESLINYCLSHGIELTRSRPWRKNDQAWIEQKNGAVVRKLLGYRRFQGIAAAQAITRLYGASRLFVNFFQPSFKLAEKHRQGAQVSKRYHPPQTPCDRLLQAESIPEASKIKLREVASALDPLKLLEEIRAMQAHLVALADGGEVPIATPEPPDLSGFVASLSSAWRAGEVRPTFSVRPSHAICEVCKPWFNPMCDGRTRKTRRRRQQLHHPSDPPLNHPNRLLNDRSSSMPRPAACVSRFHDGLAFGVPPPRGMSEHQLRTTVR